ncbi:RNA polymerase sigma factor [Minicystis rosea]|nr:RNA polymerase sigma factor [Minicystis rosea]
MSALAHESTSTRRTSSARRPNVRAKKFVPSPELCRGLEAMRSELFGHALKLTRAPEAAEDLVQDTVVRAISFQHCFQRGTNLRAWAHQILFSIFITRCRRSRLERKAMELLTFAPGAWTLPERRPEMVALSPTMARAMAALPINFRAAIVLVDIEEMSYKDAATLLGVPVGTVMSRLHRGRAQLAELMGGGPETMRAAA